MLDQLGALPLFRHKLLLTLIVMAALLLALVVSFAPVRKASADSPPPFLLEQTIGGLNLAYNLAVAANDDIRVIDRDPFDPNVGITGELKAFDKDGAPLPTNTALIEPGGIAISTTGNSVLSELFTITVRQPDGTFISSFVIDQNSFGLAINADGNYLVAQSDGGNSGRLAVYSPAGVLLDSYGDSDPLDSNTFGVEVFGVALDASGNIYASDVNNGRVLLFDSDGTFNSVFATGIGRPQGVAVDSAGNVYVSNRGAFPGNVQVFQPDGALLTTFSLPDEPGVVGFDPRGIAVDSQDRVIVGDGAFVRIFSAGLVSLWKAEGDALDDHGDNDGTLFGDAGFDANSQVGQGFLLDGSGDYVRVPHNTNLDPGTGSFTIKGWIKTSVADNFQGIVSKSERSGAQGENNPSFYVLQTDSIGNFRVSLQNDDTSQFSQVFLGSTLVADGAFHHIAFVRDVLAGEARLYVDGAIDLGATTQYFSPGWGAAQACDPTGCALQPGALGSIAAFANDTEADPLIIGGEDRVNDLGVASFFSGVIDELEFFNIALSSAQINAQFVAGGGGPGPGPGPGPGGPTIFFVSPFSGPTAGGTDVTIFGFGFVAGASLGVTFDGTAATNVSLNNDGSIAATTPFHAAEDFVDVVATSGDGAVAPTLSGGYFYGTLPTPMITSVDPSSGTTDGGTEVIITGTGFVIAFGFSVTFDGEQAASFPVFPSDTSITVTTPAHAAGAVDVVVTNPDGQTATSSYTYGAGAQVTHTMTLNKDGTGTGTVTGAGVHNEGSEVAITAVADAGSTFDGWGGPDGADCTDGLVTMDADKSCTATFTLVTHTLTLNKVGTGTGTVTGAGVHNEGSEVAITAVADAGSTFGLERP